MAGYANPRSGASYPSAGGGKKARWRRRLVIGLLLLILLIVIVPLAARLYFSDSRIRTMAEQTLSEAFGRKVTVGQLRLALFSSVEIANLKIEDKTEYGGDLLTLERARVAYRPLSLLGDEIEIPEIRVESLNLRVVKTAEGRMNVADLPPGPPAPAKPAAPEPAAPAEVPNFRIGKITVAKVGLDYDDRAAQQKISIRDFGVAGTCLSHNNSVKLDLAAEVAKVTLQSGTAAARTVPPIKAELQVKLDAARNAFELPKAEVKGEGVSALFSGKGSVEKGAPLDLSGTVALDLAGDTLTALSGLEGQRGTLDLDLEASGTIPEVSASFRLAGQDLAWPVETGEGESAMFTLASISGAKTVSGNIEKQVVVRATMALRDMGITGKGRKLDAIDYALELEADMADQSARLTRLDLQGPGLALSAKGHVDPIRDGARPLYLDAALKVDLARAMEPLVPSVRNCQGEISLDAAVQGTSLAPVMDLVLSAPAIALTQTDTGASYRIEGLEVTEKSSLSPDKARVPIEGSFRIARFDMITPESGTQTFRDFTAGHSLILDASGDTAELENLKVSLPGLSVTAKGSARELRSDDPGVDLAAAASLDFDQVLAWAAPSEQGNLHGAVRLDASLSGSKKTPLLTASLKSDRISARQPGTGDEASVEKLALSLRSTAQDDGALRISANLEPLTARVKPATGSPIELAGVTFVSDLVADLDKQEVRDISMKLIWQKLEAALTGKIRQIDAPEPALDLVLAAKVPFDQAAALAPMDPWNILGLLQGQATVKGTQSDLNLAADFKIDDLELSNPAEQTTARIPRTAIALETHVVGRKSADLDASLETGPVQVTRAAVTKDLAPAELRLAGRADLAAMNFRLAEGVAKALGSELEITADLTDLSSTDPGLVSELKGTIVFPPELAAFVPAAAAISGDPITLDGESSGKLSNLNLAFRANGKRVAYDLKGHGFPLILETPLSAALTVSPAPQGLLTIVGDLKGEPRFLNTEGKEIDRFPVTASARAGYRTREQILDVESISLAGAGLKAETKGKVRIGEATPSLDASAAGTIDFAAFAPLVRAVMDLTQEECNAAGSARLSVSLSGDTANQSAILSATADRLELNYSPQEKPAEGAPAPEEGAPEPEAGPVPPAMDLTGKNATLTANVGSLVLNGLAVKNAVLDANSRGSLVEIRTLSGELAGGTLNLAGTANTAVPGWDFKIKGQVQHLALSELIALTDPAKADQLRGSAGLGLELSGRGLDMASLTRNLQGHGEVSMGTFEITPKSSLQTIFQVTGLSEFADTIRFDAFDSAFSVRDGTVLTKDLTMKAEKYTAMFTGGVDLDGSFRDAGLILRLSPEMAARLPVPGFQGKEPNLEGTEYYDLPISISGTLGAPKPGVDWKQVGAQLFQRSITDLLGPGEKTETKEAIKGIIDLFGRPKEK